MTATSSLAGVHENNWVHGFVTFEETNGNVWADRELDGTWIEINGQTGEYYNDLELSDEALVTTKSGRMVAANQYYRDSTIYVGDEIQADIDREAAYKAAHEWDYFWGTTLHPDNTGWNDFWATCSHPEEHPGNPVGACFGTVAVGIGVALTAGIGLLAVAVIAPSIYLTATTPGILELQIAIIGAMV